ncbi:MAG: hypothetical protein JWM80_2750 [Cyanobacteria bacterium RYN_339]|nr:hypothetical protein [Cyanobacteria bacterium RYN_339]
MNIKHAFHKVIHGTTEVARGVADAGVDEAKGVVDVAQHPGRTARGVGRLVTHPKSTLAALGTDQPGAPDNRSGARKAGAVVGHLGLDVLSLGTAPVLHAAKAADSVGEAGAAHQQVGEVRVGDVFKGAGSVVVEPAKETIDAVAHPGRTARGLGHAVKHPKDAVVAAGRQPAPVERSDGQKVGRGLIRLVGPAVPGLGTARHVAEAGSKVDRATRE